MEEEFKYLEEIDLDEEDSELAIDVSKMKGIPSYD